MVTFYCQGEYGVGVTYTYGDRLTIRLKGGFTVEGNVFRMQPDDGDSIAVELDHDNGLPPNWATPYLRVFAIPSRQIERIQKSARGGDKERT